MRLVFWSSADLFRPLDRDLGQRCPKEHTSRAPSPLGVLLRRSVTSTLGHLQQFSLLVLRQQLPTHYVNFLCDNAPSDGRGMFSLNRGV